MSRFPAVAGRAPRRQEEGERSIDLQEERPMAVHVSDRGVVWGTLRRLAGVTAWEVWGEVKVCLQRAEESGDIVAAFSSPFKQEANFMSSELFGLEGGGTTPKLGENITWGTKSEPRRRDT